jgi:hypothetical protein
MKWSNQNHWGGSLNRFFKEIVMKVSDAGRKMFWSKDFTTVMDFCSSCSDEDFSGIMINLIITRRLATDDSRKDYRESLDNVEALFENLPNR